ncbi:MAG: glucosidase [Polyangiaceae bacterium]|nr:glucosidase [Polyangiaceae bacterium]
MHKSLYPDDEESRRLDEDARRVRNWKRWGPYLAERQWATVREDYSAEGDTWGYFPHDHARSRTYRWGEDGLLGICDRQCRMCLSFALWNERDPFLKERLFGLTGPEGNHGEDAKELWFYLDSTPTHSYMKALYKYPQRAFPYEELVRENRGRSLDDPELEILETGVFDEGRHFDVTVEWAKASPEDLLIVATIVNRGPEAAPIHVLPTLWFRNTWSWGRSGEGYWPKPTIGRGPRRRGTAATLWSEHASLGRYLLAIAASGADDTQVYFTENETNKERLWGVANDVPYVKDAFHERVVGGRASATNPDDVGTKAAFHRRLVIPAGGTAEIRLRLFEDRDGAASSDPFGHDFDEIVEARRREADRFFEHRTPAALTEDERRVVRQARAGLLHSKQFYHYVVKDWLDGDPGHPPPPEGRPRNRDWTHLYNRDVVSMPDKWEYPWYAAWDLAFHMIPMAEIDSSFAKEQLLLFLREWYMHPNGQIPAYEFNFGDVNPPVHAWAAWRVYKMSAPRGERDRVFLARVFAKLLLNFTWWVNRKDEDDNHIFSGGFLGLDNIGVFDRSKPLPTGGKLAQADGTAWMAFYATNMLAMAFELASKDPAAEDMASKFFEHFVAIADAMNRFGGSGLWDEHDGFYYDQIELDGRTIPLRVRSIVGLIPLFTAEVLEEEVLERMPGFRKRMEWLLENRRDLGATITCTPSRAGGGGHRLLAIPSRERLERAMRYVLDEEEFLSPYGIRSLSKHHEEHPYVLRVGREEYRVDYAPGDSTTRMFGGNSNWRGPIWFPLNFLLIEALERYHFFYGDSFRVECPTGSGRFMTLKEVALEIARRLGRIFLPDAEGRVPCHGRFADRFAKDPAFRDLLLFHEYFHGDLGHGLGADHQTGWTSLVVRCLSKARGGR